MGAPLTSTAPTSEVKPGLYQVSAPPKPHADFDTVVVEAYPETGICVIRGIGKSLENDGDGSQVRAKVDALAGALEAKYGPGEAQDFCNGSEIKCESQFWMMTMSDGERMYGHRWERPTEAMSKVKVGSIFLAAQASDISTTYPVLEFHSANVAGCDKARKAASASAL